MKQLKHNLKTIKNLGNNVNPDLVWVAESRARLIQQISNTVVPVEKPVVVDTAHAFWFQFRSSAMVRVLRPAMTALGVAALATGGWIAGVSASVNSLPGDRLWVVKRVAQNTEVAVKSIGATENEKVQLQLNLAKNRVDDIKKAFNKKLAPDASLEDREKATKDVNTAVKDVQAAVKEVSTNVSDQVNDTTKKDTALEMVETVKSVAKDTNALAKDLVSTVASSTSAGVEVTKQVIQTVKVVNQTGISAVEAVINQETQLAKSGEANNVKNIVAEKVVDLVQSTEALKNDLKTSLGVPSISVKTSEVPLLLTVPTPTGTAVVALPVITKVEGLEKTTSDGKTSATVIKEAEAKTADIHQTAVEIKKSIDSGNLQEAVNKLKDLNETVGTTQQELVQSKSEGVTNN